VSVREQAVAALKGLWPDGGAVVLRGAGVATSWEEVLAPLPDELLGAPGPPAMVGETLLGRLREIYGKAGRKREAMSFARAAWDRTSSRLGNDHPMAQMQGMRLGALLDELGRHDEATPYLERAFKVLYKAFGTDPRAATAAQFLARNLRNRGDLPAADARLQDALSIRRITNPTKIGLLLAQIAEVRREVGGDEAAAPVFYEAWETLCRERGPHDRVTLDRARVLGPMALRLGDPESAAEVLESLWAWVEKHGSPEERAKVAFEYGRALEAIGHDDRGVRMMNEGLRWTREQRDTDGGPHPDLAQRLATWARVNEQRGRPQEAEGYLLEAVEIDKQVHGAGSAQVGIRQAAVGDLVYRMGRLDEAIGWMDAGLGLLRSDLGDEAELTALVAERLIDLLLEKADECFDVYRDPMLGWEYIFQGRGITLDILGPEHPAHKTLKYYRGGER